MPIDPDRVPRRPRDPATPPLVRRAAGHSVRRVGQAVLSLILLLPCSPARAHSIVVDGVADDWWGALPLGTNVGRIARNAAAQGEYVWRDVAGDERTDLAAPDSSVDITQVRVTGTATGLAVYVGLVSTVAPPYPVQIQIAVDTDRVTGSGQAWLGVGSDTRVAEAARWERLIQTRFGSGGTAVVLDTNFSVVASAPAVLGVAGAELFVGWTALGFGGAPATPLRLTLATFHCSTNDQIVEVGDASVANALDVVTTYGTPGIIPPPNTWQELSDQIIDYSFDVWFRDAGQETPGEVYAPLLIDKCLPNSSSPDEFVTVRNVSPAALDLSVCKVGDEETPRGNEGMYRFPAGATLAAGSIFTAANRGTLFTNVMPYAPDAEFTSGSALIPDLLKDTIWASGTWGLNNSGDEALLLDGSDTVLDVMTYGTGAYPGVTAIALPAAQQLLRRTPCARDTDDCSVDFVNLGALATALQITTLTISNSCVGLAWTEVGCDYAVECATNLGDGSWQSATGTAWPVGLTTWTSGAPMNAAPAGYRVRRY
jgi:hypothetical protein